MTNEAFARAKIDALLALQGWDALDSNAVPFEVMLPDGIAECVRRRHITVPAAAEQNFRED